MCFPNTVLLFATLIMLNSCAFAQAADCRSMPSQPACRSVSPAPTVPPQRGAPPPALPAPALKSTCQPGGCIDSDARRYQGGTGTTYLDSAGRPCHRNGTWLQCF